MKPQPATKDAAKGKGKTPAKSKKTPAKGGASTGENEKSTALPPMNSKKVAKAPTAALRKLSLGTNEPAKPAGKKLVPHSSSASSATVVSNKKVKAEAPAARKREDTSKTEALAAKKPKATAAPKPKAGTAVKKETAPATKVAAPIKPKTKLNSKKLALRGKSAAKKKVWQRFEIDCSCVVEDQILDLADFEKYIKTHTKVNKKINNLGDMVTLERSKQTSLIINSSVHFSKRYFKYLSKRYLKKNSLRDWVRVVSSGKDSFTMCYFKIQSQEDDDEEVVDNKT
ncbi:large ribosomal subunit protein eL22 isoform X1 [Drosophila bipectinata]|uniref:large ribosomal subunit protein eL22 isoform X2 n=1 Tax=Drosophila bipectinata TaxID=42026 RepID=UPI001C8969E7|nr:60S ribosomal protein L22 [Drosophila bipectinata]